MKRRQFWFWSVFATLLAAVTLGGLEALSAFVVPPWPARELRSIVVPNPAVPSADPRFSPQYYNSWGVRDRERSLQKPEGVFRTVMVVLSWVEGGVDSSACPPGNGRRAPFGARSAGRGIAAS